MGKATSPTDGTGGRKRHSMSSDQRKQAVEILKAMGVDHTNVRAFTVRYDIVGQLVVTVEQYVEHPEGHSAVLDAIGERKWIERVFEEEKS